ncbi:D(1C) dopamine receptor [Anabrus simplex]|uniref:D(1C) dopamine receptor n=1 Tax=Anabrus simplex TaxID=316456 RepID=UPI0034DD40B5
MSVMKFCGDDVNNKTIPLGQLTWSIIDATILTAILCGNLLTICAVFLSRHLSNVLSNYFVLSLAVSDLMVGLTLPYDIAFTLCTELEHYKTTCIMRFVLVIMPCCVSIYNLIIIAVDRYIAIVHPLHYYAYVNKRVAMIVLAMGWLVALLLSTVPTYWNWYDQATECELDQVIPRTYLSYVLTPLFLLVWVVMLILYWKIWREAAGHAKRLRNVNHLQNGPSDWKSFQMVMLILGCFSSCWLPLFVVACTRAYGIRSYESSLLYKIAFSLGMANSSINPVIYAWKNTEFKSAFWHLLHCQSPNRAEPFLLDTTEIQLHGTTNSRVHSISSHEC